MVVPTVLATMAFRRARPSGSGPGEPEMVMAARSCPFTFVDQVRSSRRDTERPAGRRGRGLRLGRPLWASASSLLAHAPLLAVRFAGGDLARGGDDASGSGFTGRVRRGWPPRHLRQGGWPGIGRCHRASPPPTDRTTRICPRPRRNPPALPPPRSTLTGLRASGPAAGRSRRRRRPGTAGTSAAAALPASADATRGVPAPRRREYDRSGLA